LGVQDPEAITSAGTHVWVANYVDNSVTELSASTGALVKVLSGAVPAPEVVTFTQVTCPSDDADGLHAPGLRCGDKRVMAVMSTVVGFGNFMAGFNNGQLTELVATRADGPYTARQATYDLRRLRRKQLIERLPNSNRYQLTPLGRRVPCSSPRPMGVCSHRCSSNSTPPYPPTSPLEAHSRPPGATSTAPSRTTSAASSRPREHDLFVNFALSKLN
jgi:hypothetical protein